MDKMYQKSCDDLSCGFTVKSRDKNEVVTMIQQHAKNKHNIDAPTEEVLAKVKEI